jgi:hypothetical protein
MKIAVVDLRTLTSVLLLAATCSCSSEPEQQAPGTSGTSSGGTAGTAGGSIGGAGTAGSIGGGGSATGGTSAAGAGGTSAAGTGGTIAAGAGGTAGTGGTSGGSAGSAGSAGSGFGGAAAPGTPTFTQVAALIQTSCGSKCHSGEREDLVNLSATDPTKLYTKLTTPLDTDLCFNVVPLQRGSAATSLLSRVIKTDITTPCPLHRMPVGCGEQNVCLSDADIAIIDGWINAGAFQN